jgi:ketosteroid isomerase-like protein
MRKLALYVATVIVATTPFTIAQDTNLRAQLEATHRQWFEAFDKGDGAAMEKLEATNLVLVFQNGEIWKKPGSRVGKVKPTGVKSRSLSDVDVRQFGDAAVLTGLLKSVDGDSKPSADATTVVFIRQAGKWMVASAHWSPKM